MVDSSKLFSEIHQQPAVLRRFVELERPRVAALAAAIRARNVDYVMIAARGTSDNAGRYAKYLLGAKNRLPVALAAPSLFSIYGKTPLLRNALVLGISQSGRSPDIVSVVAEARAQGALTAAITNAPDSDLAGQADHIIELHAGEEKSVAATKTYTSSLAAIALLSALLGEDDAMLATLERAPDAVATVLATEPHIRAAAERYRYMRDCIVIGRGYNYATAFELALKLKELTYTSTEPYSSADFLHGPLALIEYGYPAILIAPSGKMLIEIRAFLEVLQARKAETLIISDDAALLSTARTPLPLAASLPEWLSPLTAIVPGQLFAMHLAAARDYDPDHPRGLHKVTETR